MTRLDVTKKTYKQCLKTVRAYDEAIRVYDEERSLPWLPIPSGKYKGLTLPELLFTDIPYFYRRWREMRFRKGLVIRPKRSHVEPSTFAHHVRDRAAGILLFGWDVTASS